MANSYEEERANRRAIDERHFEMDNVKKAQEKSGSYSKNLERAGLEGRERAAELYGPASQYTKGLQEMFKYRQEQMSGKPGIDKALPIMKGLQLEQKGLRSAQARAGVKGSAAASTMAASQRQKEVEAMAMSAAQKRTAAGDYQKMVGQGLQAHVGTEMAEKELYTAIRAGEAAERAAAQPPPDSGKIICTELFHQKLMAPWLYKRDQEYGTYLKIYEPHVLSGYHFWAKPIVKLMQKSKTITHIVKFFAMPWAKHISGESNIVGSLMSFFGEPICGVIGRIIEIKERGENAKV